MAKLSVQQLQRHSPWLALGASFLIVVLTISVTLIWPASSLGSDGGDGDSVFTTSGLYRSPQACRGCHQEEYEDWSTTTHAQASFDPVFQVYLQQVAQPGECFACHSTGYNANTGRFALAGVTCEACHGPYRSGHPQESMTIATAEDLCGTCHTHTLLEWQSSRHGEAGITCVDCHEVHTQQTHAAASTGALCAACHADRTQDSTHILHSRADVFCTDCHLARSSKDVGMAVNGEMETGHSFAVFVRTCRECHPTGADTGVPQP